MSRLDAILEGELAQKLMLSVASVQPNFRASRTIGVLVPPRDVGLYRRLLPDQFEMPAHPLVAICITDNIDVGPWPLTRYQLGFISLRSSYRGEEGWHPVTMPENKWVPVWAGRTMGFPKYVADHVSLVQVGDGWRGQVIHARELRFALEFVPGDVEAPQWLSDGWDVLGPTHNLRPPSRGPRVSIVRENIESDAHRTPDIVTGPVTVICSPGEPAAGLVQSGATFYGSLTTVRDGGARLQPEG